MVCLEKRLEAGITEGFECRLIGAEWMTELFQDPLIRVMRHIPCHTQARACVCTCTRTHAKVGVRGRETKKEQKKKRGAFESGGRRAAGWKASERSAKRCGTDYLQGQSAKDLILRELHEIDCSRCYLPRQKNGWELVTAERSASEMDFILIDSAALQNP